MPAEPTKSSRPLRHDRRLMVRPECRIETAEGLLVAALALIQLGEGDEVALIRGCPSLRVGECGVDMREQ